MLLIESRSRCSLLAPILLLKPSVTAMSTLGTREGWNFGCVIFKLLPEASLVGHHKAEDLIFVEGVELGQTQGLV